MIFNSNINSLVAPQVFGYLNIKITDNTSEVFSKIKRLI